MGEDSAELVRFQSLEFSATPWTRWASGLAINTAAVLALVAIPVTVQNVISPDNHLTTTTLTAPAQPVPTKVIPKPLKKLAPVPVIAPRVQFQAPPSKPLVARSVVLPDVQAQIPKLPEVVRLDAPKIDLPSRQPAKVNVFPLSLSAAPPVAEVPAKAVQTGGFGNPNGVQPSASARPQSALQTVGSFDAPTGPGNGKASGSGRAVANTGFGVAVAEGPASPSGSGRTVASAGFGATLAGAPASSPNAVQQTAFGEYAAPKRAPANRVSAPAETPVEITFKPKPVYTADALEKKIEGEVQLEVLFSSSGEVRVLRVIRGLGFGLDESARVAAGKIRFRPGTRNGNAVDMTGTVHIIFEIS